MAKHGELPAIDHGRRPRQGAAGGRASAGSGYLASAGGARGEHGRLAVRGLDPRPRAAGPDLPRPRRAAGRRGRGHGPAHPHGRVRRPHRVGVRRARARTRRAGDQGGPGARRVDQERPAWTSWRIGNGRPDPTVRSLGIDVGVAKGLDLVLMDERRVPLAVRSHTRPEEVGALIDEFRPDVVAIDSPPRWAATGRSRRTERELAACNIQSFNTPSETHGRGNAFFAWMEVGFEVFRIGGRARVPDVWRRIAEASSHGGLPARDGRRAGRQPAAERRLEARLARARPACARGTNRRADARSTGSTRRSPRSRDCWRSTAERFAPGDPDGGRHHAAGEHAPGHAVPAGRRTPPAPWPRCSTTVPAATRSARRLVRGEFAPGHDAKRKAMLWRRAREGRAAIDELEERGWKLPPEMR